MTLALPEEIICEFMEPQPTEQDFLAGRQFTFWSPRTAGNPPRFAAWWTIRLTPKLLQDVMDRLTESQQCECQKKFNLSGQRTDLGRMIEALAAVLVENGDD